MVFIDVFNCELCIGFTLVVSPLLSLMEDQVIALRSLGIDAGMFHAQSGKEETNRLMVVRSKTCHAEHFLGHESFHRGYPINIL